MTVNDLLKLPGIEALGWAEAVWVGQQYSPISFNWLLLAEAAASQVHHVPIDLSWAELSVRVYDRLSAQTRTPDSLENSAMLLRVACLQYENPQPGHIVLDTEILFRWWAERLDCSFAWAEARSPPQPVGTSITIDDIKRLRRIKNRLNILAPLQGNSQVTLPPDLLPWLALRSQLP